jgi:hypothetical protein
MMAKTIEEPLDERVRRMAKDFPFNGYVNVRAIEFAHLLDTRDKHIRALEAALSASRTQSAQLAEALEHYAEKSNWSREARWTYETGRINAGGIEEESEAHVDLDTECVWNGEGDNGWEKADTALTAWRQGNK